MQLQSFLKNPKYLLLLEYSIFSLAVFYFGMLLLTEHKTLGLEEPIIEIPIQIKQANGTVLYVLLAMLSVELALKYMKIRNLRQFLKKYWLDIAMVILIPVFSGIKIFKTLQIAKKAKIIKYGFKAADKTQKIHKNHRKTSDPT